MPEKLRRQRLEIKNNAVKDWLAERNQLIISYCRLTGRRHQNQLPDDEQLNQFCGLLVDYVSAGHFEVYEKIVGECDTNGASSIELLESLYPHISETTDIVVDFHDKYGQLTEGGRWVELDQDLSLLGEAIAKRVDLEDSLIDTLRTRH